MARIIDILGELSRSLGVPVLTPEYEIALTLLDRPNLTADQLLEQSSFSRAGFFNTMDRLKAIGSVVSTPSPMDRRSKMYRLSDPIHDLIVSRFKQYRVSYDALMEQGIKDIEFVKSRLLAKRENAFSHLSCEFQIIYYAFLSPGIANNDLMALVDVSQSKFLASLRELSIGGIMTYQIDPSDKRRRLYDVNETVRQTVNALNDEVFSWLENIASTHADPPEVSQAENHPPIL